MVGGMVTFTLPDELAPGARIGTDRVPVSTLGVVVQLVSAEKRYCVVDAGADPMPMFAVVSVTLKLLPASAIPGGSLTAVTTRSSFLTWTVLAAARQLFVSLLSDTTCRLSAQAQRT